MIKGAKFKPSLYDAVCTIGLFIIAINFNRLELYLLVILFGYMLFKDIYKSIVINTNILTLFLFSLTYTLIIICKGQSFFTSVLTYLVCPVAAYYIGYGLVRRDNLNRISCLFLAIAVGRGTHGLLNLIPYIRDGYTARNPIDFWTGNVLASTGAGTLFIMAVSLVYYAMNITKSNKRQGILLILFCTLCIFSAIQLGTRGCLVVAVITLVLCIIFFTDFRNKSSVRAILLVVAIATLFYIAYSVNMFGLRTAFESSGLYRRIYVYDVEGLDENERWTRQYYMLSHLFDYPFGADDLTYTHNLWLDVARLTGIVPFFISIVMTMSLLASAFKGIKSNLIDRNTRILLFSVISGSFMIFFAEPVLEGCPSFFILFIMMCAMCEKIRYLESKVNIDE